MLFAGITGFRRWLYERGYWTSYKPPIPTIVIGNLSTGGTGKTPTVAYLIEELENAGIKVGVVSRGYGRKTRGVFEVISLDANKFGDEPSMLKAHFPSVPIFVAENRALGIKTLLSQYPKLQAILLDDAFQHFAIRPSLRILLTTQNRPFWKDFPLPKGRLREPRRSARFADAIVMTKISQPLSPFEANRIDFGLKTTYQLPDNLNPTEKVWLVAGLADNESFFSPIKALHPNVVGESAFSDHHPFSEEDVLKIIHLASKEGAKTILTTAKDEVKLKVFSEVFSAQGIQLEVVQINFKPFVLPSHPAQALHDFVTSHVRAF